MEVSMRDDLVTFIRLFREPAAKAGVREKGAAVMMIRDHQQRGPRHTLGREDREDRGARLARVRRYVVQRNDERAARGGRHG